MEEEEDCGGAEQRQRLDESRRRGRGRMLRPARGRSLMAQEPGSGQSRSAAGSRGRARQDLALQHPGPLRLTRTVPGPGTGPACWDLPMLGFFFFFPSPGANK